MSKEELMRPRYKVIAPWPGMHVEPFHVGQIVTLQPHTEEDAEGFIYVPNKHVPKSFMWQSFFDLFPHLFKKLEWYEERKVEEMPEYIMFSKDYCNFRKGEIFKTENWNKQHEAAGFCIGFITGPGEYDKCAVPASCGVLPATQTEYEQYINQKEKQ